MKTLSTSILVLSLVIWAALSAQAQTGENVLVVINANSPASVEIGEYYADARGVPREQVLRLATAVSDEVSRPVYAQQIEAPIRQWLQLANAQDRILYIVLTKGVPLRVAGSTGRNGTLASVDSELTLLYRKMSGITVPAGGRLPNPYFTSESASSATPLFSHKTHDIMLVTRLDGFTVEDVIALVDRGLKPASDGQVLLDQKADPDSPGDRWLADAADAVVNASHDRVLLEPTTRGITAEQEVLGYYSWGSSDPALLTRLVDFEFVPGAIAGSYVGTSARTFTEPPEGWGIGLWRDRSTYYAGTPESLAGDLVRAGVTGVAGHVADPFLDGAIRPAQLFASYLNGFNLAESFYSAMPDLSWRTVVVGDPLVAPFRQHNLTADLAAPELDQATQLPRFFSARTVEQMVADGTPLELATVLIHANRLLITGDHTAARPLLEQATELAPTHIPVHIRLGQLYEESDEHHLAADRYRRVLVLDPNNVIALNNLAFLLIGQDGDLGDLDEAFRFAQRAFTLSGGNPAIADTLGWIQHLRGNNREAARYLATATDGMPESASVRLHAATVYHALGQLEAATQELSKATSLDPALNDAPNVVNLRSLLRTAGSNEAR